MNTPIVQHLLELALHHLWQGAVLAGCVWLACRMRPRWSAESRYWVWTAALLLVAALPLLGQVPLPRPSGVRQVVDFVAFTAAEVGAPAPDAIAPLVAATASAPSGTSVSWLPVTLLALWAAGFLWQLTSLLRGAHTLRRWIREARLIAADQLPLPRAALANCEVRESEDVSVPMVAGMLRPCILLPIGLHTRLPQSQLALVLRHELAHVRRGDAWLLLLQRLIAAVYFYNPVVHFIARRVERERECSCDDRALHAAQASVEYADCLIDISRQAVHGRAPALGVGAIRRTSDLRVRIERLLARSPSDDTRFSAGSVAAATCTLAVVAAALALSLPRADAADATARTGREPGSAASPENAANRAFVRDLAEDGMSLETARARLSGVDVNYALEGDGTPLIIAARSGDVGLVRLLLENHADVDRFSSGDGNPLIAAAAAGHMPIVTMLVERGANVNAQDPYDETPLINAARRGHLAVVEFLIAKGADVNLAVRAQTGRGIELRSPLSEARKAGHRAIVERLQQSGASR